MKHTSEVAQCLQIHAYPLCYELFGECLSFVCDSILPRRIVSIVWSNLAHSGGMLSTQPCTCLSLPELVLRSCASSFQDPNTALRICEHNTCYNSALLGAHSYCTYGWYDAIMLKATILQQSNAVSVMRFVTQQSSALEVTWWDMQSTFLHPRRCPYRSAARSSHAAADRCCKYDRAATWLQPSIRLVCSAALKLRPNPVGSTALNKLRYLVQQSNCHISTGRQWGCDRDLAPVAHLPTDMV